MLTKAVTGIFENEIYVHIGRSYDFIEAHCTSLFHPDYAYKRFPCNFDGYLNAHNWVLETATEMFKNRIATVGFDDSYTESKYPRCYDWTDENKKNEPCCLSIELDF